MAYNKTNNDAPELIETVSYTHLGQKTIEALMSLDLPAGVEIEIKL